MITNFVVVGLSPCCEQILYKVLIGWFDDEEEEEEETKQKQNNKKAKQKNKQKQMPRVRIELTTFRSLCFSDYETDALPTALSRHDHHVGVIYLYS